MLSGFDDDLADQIYPDKSPSSPLSACSEQMVIVP